MRENRTCSLSGGRRPALSGAPPPTRHRIAVEQNTEGGRGPCGGRAGRGGKREGMAGQEIRSNHPRGREPVDKVRQLRRRLWAAAKRSPERRFHAIYDRICRSDVLREAWRRGKRNGGAAGVDRQTLAEVEELGVERLLEELQTELRAGEYRSEERRVG